ncbi:MAG TPA: hypothetical protein VFZ34_03780, partial [Blastocatellia bacterium]|nr:hypothetical protein [Blastocatellia bacterium]
MSDSPTPTKPPRRSARRTRVILLSIATLLLAVSLLVLQAFNTEEWFAPGSASETLILFALSTLNVIAFIVLLMVLARNIIKLRGETRPRKLGSRFMTRLVSFSVALSLLPVVFMFSSTVLLINRSVEKWFSLPTRKMAENARQIQDSYLQSEEESLQYTALTLARLASSSEDIMQTLKAERSNQRLASIEIYEPTGKVILHEAAPETATPNNDLTLASQQLRARLTNDKPAAAQAVRDNVSLSLL